MATLRECLQSLRGDLVMRDLAAVRNEVAPVSEHIARLRKEEDGYEVRRSTRNYGRTELIEVGLVGGPTIFRQA
ncbi:hypothetical protein [Cupriavidus sp. TMH.W2]|uniref:hypothetical protein n=1 Tax=Cupriavidus sp. TMH.W2 TaxID=3434465 RepID=UPI003D78A652